MIIKHNLSKEDAEVIGLQVLGFIASDPGQLERFTSSTGVSIEDLRQRAGSVEISLACLGEILKNEPDLLMFCANANIEPDKVRLAEALLDGIQQDDEWH